MGIIFESQRTLHRQNDSTHAQKVQQKEPRQPVLSSVLLECARHLLRLFPLQLGTKASSKKKPLTSVDSLSLVLIFPDLTFLDVDRNTIAQPYSLELHDTGIELVQFQRSVQKTLNNGEIIN